MKFALLFAALILGIIMLVVGVFSFFFYPCVIVDKSNQEQIEVWHYSWSQYLLGVGHRRLWEKHPNTTDWETHQGWMTFNFTWEIVE